MNVLKAVTVQDGLKHHRAAPTCCWFENSNRHETSSCLQYEAEWATNQQLKCIFILVGQTCRSVWITALSSSSCLFRTYFSLSFCLSVCLSVSLFLSVCLSVALGAHDSFCILYLITGPLLSLITVKAITQWNTSCTCSHHSQHWQSSEGLRLQSQKLFSTWKEKFVD